MCYYYLLVFVLGGFGAQTGGASTLPVFIADHDHSAAHLDIPPNPLHALTVNDFTYIVREVIRRSEMVLIFVEEKFRMEDVSIKDKYGSPFFHLEEMLCAHKLKFLPAVANPYDTLTKIMPQGVLNVFHVTSKTRKLQFFNQKYKYYYLYFQDDMNTTRAQALREHDRIIKEVYSAVRQLAGGPVVAFYTGMAHPSASGRKQVVIDSFQDYHRWSQLVETNLRQRRANMTNTTYLEYPYDNIIIDEDGHFSFAYKEGRIGSLTVNEYLKENNATSGVTSILSNDTLVVLWKWKDVDGSTFFTIKFNFTLEDEGYRFEKIIMEAKTNSSLLRSGTVEDCTFPGFVAPSWKPELVKYKHSIKCNTIYNCRVNLVNKEILVTFSIDSYQVQVTRGVLNGFDEPILCPGYMEAGAGSYISPGIASGLVVCLVWVGLMTFGIVMMVSVNTNDKFDSAQGVQLLFSES